MSVMTTAWGVVEPRITPLEGAERLRVAVSVLSTNVSLVTVKVTLPLVWPFGMAMDALLKT